MATLKELAARPELLSGGHRMCAGCGAPIIVRAVLRAQTHPVVAACATGCLEVSTTIYPYSAWRCSYIHNAFENVAATLSGVETAYRALKKKGKLKDEIRFVGFGGDGGIYDIGLQALSGAMERGHRMLIICYDNGAYMNCLSTSSMIMTKDGLRKITDIKEGDYVYAFDQKTHQLVLKKCSGVFDNGIKDVYELSTLHHSIKATSNHPFLVLQRNGRGKTNTLVWKTLAEIKVGDEIVTLKNIETKKSTNFDNERVTNIKYVGKEPTLDLRVEDEHNFIADGIVVHNTGVQRSSATPRGAATTTCPPGKYSCGKQEYRKDVTAIMVAHRIPYVAQASPHDWRDLTNKVEKALSINGPSFIAVISPCPLGWESKPDQTVDLAKLAADTCYWPLFEVENGTWKLNYKPKEMKPVIEWFKLQGRFSHLTRPENRAILDEIQAQINHDWEELVKRCEGTK